MVERVMPIEGATVAVFDWEAAESALEILATVPTTFGTQVADRDTAGNTVSEDWSGPYQNDFREAEGYIRDWLEADQAATSVAQVEAAMVAANVMQTIYNAQRTLELAEEEE